MSKKAVWLGLVVVGPFALPFLWFSPFFSRRSKIGITLFSAVLTVLMWKSSLALLTLLNQRLGELKEMGVY